MTATMTVATAASAATTAPRADTTPAHDGPLTTSDAAALTTTSPMPRRLGEGFDESPMMTSFICRCWSLNCCRSWGCQRPGRRCQAMIVRSPPQVPLYLPVSAAVDEPVTPETPVEKLRATAERHDVGVDPAWLPGKVVEELFEALVQDTLQAPRSSSTTRWTPRH
jgi:hypothetical protein